MINCAKKKAAIQLLTLILFHQKFCFQKSSVSYFPISMKLKAIFTFSAILLFTRFGISML